MSVGESGLDETGDPARLIVADMPAIGGAVGHLRRLDTALDRGGRGLKGIDVDGWQGDAAEAFRRRFDESPARWFAAADAFGKAVGVCESFRHTVAWAGADAARTVEQAAAVAPDPPSFWGKAGAEISDEFADVGRLLAGAGEGIEDIAKATPSLNPLDPWNVTHPAAFVDGVSSTAAGLVTANLHPAELVKGATGTGWGSDPAHAFGKLIPGAALTVATGGAGRVAAGVAERGTVVAGRGGVAREASAAGSFVRPTARTASSSDLPARATMDPRYSARSEATRGGSHWSPGQDRSIFVMDGNGNLYASNGQRVGELHHSSFLGGQPVAGAGEIGVRDGCLTAAGTIARPPGMSGPGVELSRE